MKEKLLDGYSKMREDIAISKDKHLRKIWLFVREEMDSLPKDRFLDDIEYRILKSLEETYSITSAAARKLYGIKAERLKDGEIEELLYSKDGKTLRDRLETHYDNAQDRANATQYFQNRIVLVMDTETLTVSNSIIHSKVNKDAKFAEVVGGANCWEENGGDCEYWISKGKMPIEELSELPPYHPDCECGVIYYFE